jgi:hypothetical protein
MIYGYARVSTDGQSVTAQVAALRAAGAAQVFREVASGAKTDRAQLRRGMAALNPGDVLLVTRLDRLARSTRDLLNTLAAIAAKGAAFRSLGDAWADTTTAQLLLLFLRVNNSGVLAYLRRFRCISVQCDRSGTAKFAERFIVPSPERDSILGKLLNQGFLGERPLACHDPDEMIRDLSQKSESVIVERSRLEFVRRPASGLVDIIDEPRLLEAVFEVFVVRAHSQRDALANVTCRIFGSLL